LLAIIRKISLPVSAQECAASATMDAEPVSAAAQDLAIATSRLALNAISTVRVLSLPPPPALLEPRVTIGLGVPVGSLAAPGSAAARAAV